MIIGGLKANYLGFSPILYITSYADGCQELTDIFECAFLG